MLGYTLGYRNVLEYLTEISPLLANAYLIPRDSESQHSCALISMNLPSYFFLYNLNYNFQIP